MSDLLLDLKQVQAKLPLRKTAIYDLAKKGDIISSKIGRRVFFFESSVDALIKKNRRQVARRFFDTHHPSP